jgi:putative transposase
MKKESQLKPVKTPKIYKKNLPNWEYSGSLYFITFSTKEGILLEDIAKDIVVKTLHYHVGKKYILFAFVVMNTHVHLIIEPLENSSDSYFSLGQILHSIKSYSANQINKNLQRNGVIWLDERYDRVIRNDDELFEEMSYIINNR